MVARRVVVVCVGLALLAPSLGWSQVLGPTHMVSNPAYRSTNPSVATEADGTIDVAWNDETHGTIVFARSGDGGVTFSSETIVTTGGDSPSIGVTAQGVILVAWRNYAPYCARSVDHGQTFSTPVALGPGGINNRTDVAVTANGTIAVAWSDGSNVIRCARSTDAGVSFSPSVPISSSSVVSHYPRCAAFGAQVQVAWTSFIPPAFGSEIQTASSIDDAASFSAPLTMAVAPGGGSQQACTGVGPDGQTLVAWYDQVGAIGVRRSLDYGVSFEPAQLLIPISSGGGPDVTVDDVGDVFITASDNGDLFMCSSPNLGEAYNTVPADVSVAPSMAGGARGARLPGRSAVVVWHEVIDFDAVFIGLRIAGAGPTAVPLTTPGARLAVSPNPARPGATVRIVANEGDRDVAITDIGGRLIRRLEPAGVGGVIYRWDGRDAAGRSAPAGLYLVRATGAGGPVFAKLVTLR